VLTDLATSLPETGADAVARLRERFGGVVLSGSEFRGEHTVVVPARFILGVCNHCRNSLGFDFLVDVCSIDNPDRDPRFEVVYHVYSYPSGVHLRLKCAVPDDAPEVDSVACLWPTAAWHEREAYDMMGIRFRGHPDLRRILMWEGYPYFPLRKEFPLGGRPSEMPDVAFTGVAPLEGGPFVTKPGAGHTSKAEPRARPRE
jgi:NADH-quinone oxidoreductase subunit C